MGTIKFILGSNRGSYTGEELIVSQFEMLKAEVNGPEIFMGGESSNLNDLNGFIKQNPKKYLLGYLSYELGFQVIEQKTSTNRPLSSLPVTWLMAVDKKQVTTNIGQVPTNVLPTVPPIKIKQLVSKETYIKKLQALKKHIQLGDVYEINYCIPFAAENIELDPEKIWTRLSNISPMPFSAFVDHPDFSIIGASPERFIKKQDNKLFIQPMKGTRPRGKTEGEDNMHKAGLKQDPKERAENVMIVDLTRNDLSKIAKKGSVHVDELFGVYTFKSVHQMVSTVSCELEPGKNFTDILQATFPMGSMTGAPKKRAVQLIEEYEDFARGPFSGMLGYIDPDGNFDFNVMIRTVFYDKKERKLFMAVGSAITSGSDVEKEYEECLIKLQPLLQALNATIE